MMTTRPAILPRPATAALLILAAITATFTTAPRAFSQAPAATAAPTSPAYDTPQLDAIDTADAHGNGMVALSSGSVTLASGPMTPRAAIVRPVPRMPSAMEISGKVRSFHPPPGGWFVECFFIVKPADHKPLLYSADGCLVAPGGQGGAVVGVKDFTFSAPGNADKYLALPDVSYQFNQAGATKVADLTFVTLLMPTGDLTQPPPLVRTHINGWILRVFIGDQLVLTKASEDSVEKSAASNPGYFDKAYALLKPANAASPAPIPDTAATAQIPAHEGPSQIPIATPASLHPGPGAPSINIDTSGDNNPNHILGTIAFTTPPPPAGYKIICVFLQRVPVASGRPPQFNTGEVLTKDAYRPTAVFDFVPTPPAAQSGKQSGQAPPGYSDWAVCIAVNGQIAGIRGSSPDAVKLITATPSIAIPPIPPAPQEAGDPPDPAHPPFIEIDPLDPKAGNAISHISGTVRYSTAPPRQGYRIVCLFMQHVPVANAQQPQFNTGAILTKDATGPTASFDFTTTPQPAQAGAPPAQVPPGYSDWAVCILVNDQVASIRGSDQDLVKQITDNPSLAIPKH